MNTLLSLLMHIFPLSAELQAYLLRSLRTRHYGKRDYLLRAEQVCESIWFIESGLVRCYYDKGHKQVCSWFMKERDVIISVHSFFQQVPSREHIQALEDTTVHYISYQDLQYIYRHFPEFNIHGRVLTEKYYALSEDRLMGMRMQNAVERYLHLMEHAAELTLRVSNADIASYLGITMETLSRLKTHVQERRLLS